MAKKTATPNPTQETPKAEAQAQAPAPKAKKAPAPKAEAQAQAPAPAPEKKPEARPELREETAVDAAETFDPIPEEVSGAKKKALKGVTVWQSRDLYIDRSVEQGGHGTYAADGREDLGFDVALTRSLLRHYSSDNKGRVYQMISPVKVSICGTDGSPMLVVLNGRQRVTNINALNVLLARIYGMWQELGGSAEKDSRVKLKNSLTALAAAARNGSGQNADLDWLEAEDVEHLVGGRVNGEAVPGLLTVGRDSDAGPMPYCVRVEYVDVSPNSPDALELSLAERISVPTPPTVQARQIQRMLKAGRTPDSVAANLGCNVKSVWNRMLVLHVIPEVQRACDQGAVSFRVLKDQFFTDTSRNGTVPKSPDVQKAILDALLGAGAGKGKAGAAVREEIKATEGGTAPAPSGAPEPSGAPAPSPAPTAAPAPKPATPSAPVGILRFLPRAASTMQLRYVASLPEPAPEMGAEGYYAALRRKEQARTAAAMMAYLGGDSAALDAFPEVREQVVKHMGEAQADAEMVAPEFDAEGAPATTRQAQVKAKGLSPEQKLAGALVNLFGDWEDLPADDRPAWPTTEDPTLAPKLAEIQGAYAAGGGKGDVGDFAREWILANVVKAG